ncbi:MULTISPECIES: hypothetical protein [Actinoplanes]|uniref:hypothetical protein n=1 Tax=Actinoplanes TaxID=1865 RepID=UPI0005F2C2DB|nr:MULTISPECIES: hypothetical protein [Actinoplanes]GLY02896.1 hypothetical protein Acsp01_32750 [Actinoplanes sp. NBRC 101535]
MSDHGADVWTLHRRGDGRLLARLAVTDTDFPWLYARVEAGDDDLTPLRPLFADELHLLNDVGTDVPAWEQAYELIRDAVTLRSPEGVDVPEFLLHVEGDEAWWRWSDEPFDEPPAEPSGGVPGRA